MSSLSPHLGAIVQENLHNLHSFKVLEAANNDKVYDCCAKLLSLDNAIFLIRAKIIFLIWIILNIQRNNTLVFKYFSLTFRNKRCHNF